MHSASRAFRARLAQPFAIASAGTRFGVVPGTEAAWRAVLAAPVGASGE